MTRRQQKRDLKLRGSSLSIFFVITSVCLLFEKEQNYVGTELRGAVSKLGRKIKIRRCVLTFSEKLQIWSFCVAN